MDQRNAIQLLDFILIYRSEKLTVEHVFLPSNATLEDRANFLSAEMWSLSRTMIFPRGSVSIESHCS